MSNIFKDVISKIVSSSYSQRLSNKGFYEENLFDILKTAERDPKESLSRFSGIRVNSKMPKLELSDYAAFLETMNMEYAVCDVVSAFKFLSADDVRVISFHPSCLGDGYGPVSVYTKKGSRRVGLLVKDSSLY